MQASQSGQLADRVSVVGHTPLINAPAHEMKTQHEVVRRCKDIRNKVARGQSVVLTSDQDVHKGLVSSKRLMPKFMEDVVLRMGVLHILIHYFRCIGLHLEDSGLSDVLAATDFPFPGQQRHCCWQHSLQPSHPGTQAGDPVSVQRHVGQL